MSRVRIAIGAFFLASALAAEADALASAPPPASADPASAWNDPANPIRRLWSGNRLDLWSLRPPAVVTPTSVPGQPVHPIDALLRARASAPVSEPPPEADRRTLIRRLSFDLTGLPPSFDEVRAFEQDTRPDAWERLVDRLLASPRYGEHQARLWLDVVRYSDSNGFDWDEFRKQAWRFRDYVIRSFNADKPFDQFIREQLAGDELFDGPPRTPAEQDCLVATGYLRLGPHDNAAPLFNEQDRSRAELMTDLVETTGSAFLGLTLSCCRCHDHKTEPLSQADHYRLRAFFEGVKFADDLPLDLAADQESIRRHNESIDARTKPFEEERERLLDTVRKRLRDERMAKLTDEERSLLELPKEKRPEDLKGRIEGIEKKVNPSDKEVNAALGEPEKKRRGELEAELSSLRKERREFTQGMLMADAPGEPPATKILFQGNHKSPRDSVAPGFLSVFDPAPAAIQPAVNRKSSGRRLTLAGWIGSTTNPFTARVFVNRVWQQHFGTGLVATANDFGLSGARPTHPELLDWLAGEFVRSRWSVKQLHRQIVLSREYKAVSSVQFSVFSQGTTPAAATENPGLKTENSRVPRRLSAEQLRDALMMVSGRLVDRAGGPPIWPELPSEILTANPAFLDDNETRTKGWYPSPEAEQGVRSVYLVQKRTVRIPFMETFDLPENSTSCGRRTESTVAPQALSLMNGPMAVNAARAFAARIEREAGADPAARITHGFRLALQRDPTPGELARCGKLLATRSLPELCRALLNLNEFAYVD